MARRDSHIMPLTHLGRALRKRIILDQQSTQPAPAAPAQSAAGAVAQSAPGAAAQTVTMGVIDEQQWAKKVPLVRVPMVGVAAAMLAGTIVGRYLHLPPALWLGACAAGILSAAVTVKRGKVRLLTAAGIALALLAVAAIHVDYCWRSVDEGHIVTYTPDTPIMCTVRGQIVTSPHINSEHLDFNYTRPPVTTFVLSVSGILTSSPASDTGVPATSSSARPAGMQGGENHGRGAHATPRWDTWTGTTGLVRVTVDTPMPGLRAGQQVQLVGKLGRYPKPDNPGGFDWSSPASNGGVVVWMTVPAGSVLEGGKYVDVVGVTALGEPGNWASRAYWNVRAAVRQHLAAAGDPQEGRLLNALITGDRHPALRELNRAMAEAGTAHYLAIAGTHLAVFLGFVYFLCRLVSLSQRTACIISLVVLAFYMLLTEPHAPLLRSAIMAGCFCLAGIFARRHTALNAYCAAMAILLALDPIELFTAGFQLSFGIVGGILVLYQPFKQMIFGRWLARRGLMVFRDDHRMRRWLSTRGADILIAVVTLNISAYAVSAPLVAYHFGYFSPYAGVLCTLLSPLISATLVTGYISMALAWPLPHVADLVGQAASWFAGATIWVVHLCHSLPGLCTDLRPVSVPCVLAAYAALVIVLIRGRMQFGWWIAGAIWAIAAGFIVCSQLPAPAPAAGQVDMLAIGAGQCAVFRSPAGQTYIFDAGTRSAIDVYEQALRPFLRDQRLPTPHVAFVSHADADHYNALAGLARTGRLKRVYTNPYFGLLKSDTRPEPGLFLKTLEENHVEVCRIAAGQTIRLDEYTSVDVLWPPPTLSGYDVSAAAAPAARRGARTDAIPFIDSLPDDDEDNRGPDVPAAETAIAPGVAPKEPKVNDTSLVLRVNCKGHSIIFTGDIEMPGQSGTVNSNPPEHVHADALVLPHHGSWDKWVLQFTKDVAPSVALVSTAHQPQFADSPTGKGRREYYDWLARNTHLYSTVARGWIRLTFTPEGPQVQTMR
jgi:ComEC/Rec2-related protein